MRKEGHSLEGEETMAVSSTDRMFPFITIFPRSYFTRRLWER